MKMLQILNFEIISSFQKFKIPKFQYFQNSNIFKIFKFLKFSNFQNFRDGHRMVWLWTSLAIVLVMGGPDHGLSWAWTGDVLPGSGLC
jgi:hypothetical protein